MLRNRRGATSLRWLRALLDHGVEVHGQVVVCPGCERRPWLEDTLAGVAERFADLGQSLRGAPRGEPVHDEDPGCGPTRSTRL